MPSPSGGRRQGSTPAALRIKLFAAARPQSSVPRSCGKCVPLETASSSYGSLFLAAAGPRKDATDTDSEIWWTALYAPRPQSMLTICWQDAPSCVKYGS
jgi:hypothetical protein